MIEEKIALIVVLISLYLGDCLLLLRPTQALASIVLPFNRRAIRPRNSDAKQLGHRPGSLLSLGFGFTFYPVRNYFPALLNPLTPWITVFKTAVILPSAGSNTSARSVPMHRLVATRLKARETMSLVVFQAALIFGAIPYFIIYGPIERLLLTLLVAFLTATAIIAFSYPFVRILRLKRRSFFSLAFQALICLPLSVNFPRKLALSAPSIADAEMLFPRIAENHQRAAALDLVATLKFAQNEVLEGHEAERAARLVKAFAKNAADE